MKSIKKILTTLATFVLACASMVGCISTPPTSGDSTGSDSSGTVVGRPIIENDELYTISSFETYEQIQALNWSRHFGRAKLNKDPEYISDGEASVMLQPYGEPEDGVPPQITVGLKKAIYNYTDFSHVKYLSLDFYNVSSDVTVEYWLQTENADGTTEYLPVKSATLRQNSWTRISYDLSTGVYGILYNMSNVTVFCVKFTDYRTTTDPYEPRTIYMDGLKVHHLKEPIEFNRKTEKDVIMNFESLQDLYLLTTSALGNASANSYSVSIDAREGTASEGKQSLYVKGKCKIKVDSRLLSEEDMNAAEKLSFDIKTLGQETAEVMLTVACKYDRVFEFKKVVSCAEGEWVTVSMEKSELDTFTFADLEYFSIEVRGQYSWIDKIHFN